MDSPDFPSDEEGIGFDEHDDLIDLGEPSAARGESNHGPWPIGFTDSFLEDAQEPQQQPGFVAPHVLVGPSFPRQSLDHSFPPPVDMGNAYISWEQSQYHSVSEFAPHVLDYDPRLLSMDFMCNYPEASTSGQQAAPFPVVRPPEEPMPSAALKAQLAVSIEDGKAEENMILLNRREAGVGYQQISDEILAQLGVKISTNALVKRWNKMQGLQMSLLPTAIKNGMPRILDLVGELVTREMERADNGPLSEAETQEVNEIMMELPTILPRFIQTRVCRKRKTTSPTTPE